MRFLSVVQGNPQTWTGCEYHRQIIPHIGIDRYYHPEIIQVDTLDQPAPLNIDGGITMDELIKSCSFVHFGRLIDSIKKEEYIHGRESFRVKEVADYIHALGVPIILDLDDYWQLSQKHILRSTFANNRQDRAIIESVQQADYVTVTTEFLADRVRRINPNVYVLPNAIDPEQPQWQQKHVPDAFNRIRFGWVGGSCHLEDFECLHDSITKLWHDDTVKGKFKIILGGFNVNDKTIVTKPDGTKDAITTPPERCIYPQFERLLTDHYKALGPYQNYVTYLQQYTPEGNGMIAGYHIPYRREWAVDTHSYGQKYNEWDVTFIPLNENEFNACKSPLKMAESGFMGKTVIVSNVLPYSVDAKHMHNAWVIDPRKNHKGWNKAMKAMINDRDMVAELSANLEKDMNEKYHIKVVSEKRWEVYNMVAGRKAQPFQVENVA